MEHISDKQRIAQVIEGTRFTNALKVEHLIDRSRLSRARFNRLFNQLYKMNPQRYIIYRIIETVKTELCNDVPLKSIASDLGYTRQALSRMFKREMGMSARDFKDRACK